MTEFIERHTSLLAQDWPASLADPDSVPTSERLRVARGQLAKHAVEWAPKDARTEWDRWCRSCRLSWLREGRESSAPADIENLDDFVALICSMWPGRFNAASVKRFTSPADASAIYRGVERYSRWFQEIDRSDNYVAPPLETWLRFKKYNDTEALIVPGEESKAVRIMERIAGAVLRDEEITFRCPVCFDVGYLIRKGEKGETYRGQSVEGYLYSRPCEGRHGMGCDWIGRPREKAEPIGKGSI